MGDTTVTADQPEETPEQKAAREEQERLQALEDEARKQAEREGRKYEVNVKDQPLKPAG